MANPKQNLSKSLGGTLLRALLLALATSLTMGCQTVPWAGSRIEQAPVTFDDDHEFRRWFTFYYQDPQPEKITAALHYMDKEGYLLSHPDIASVFLAQVFAANRTSLADWTNGWRRLKPSQWDVILIALWLVGSDDTKQLISNNLDHASRKHRQNMRALLLRDPSLADPLTIDIKEPHQINLIWAAFSATGDQRYVHRAISYVHYFGASNAGQIRSEIGQAAIMTLASNALQHQIVADICADQNENHPNPRTRILLKAMLTALRQEMNGAADSPYLDSH